MSETEILELRRLEVEVTFFGLPYMSDKAVKRYEELLRMEMSEDAPRSPSEPV